MHRCLLVALLCSAFLSACAFADSTTIFMSPNDGSGDNFGFITYGPGFYFSGDGGLPYETFNYTTPYAPGSTFPGGSELFLGGGLAKVDGMTFEIFYQPGASLFISQFTFPTQPQAFRPLVDVGFSAVGYNPFTGQTFDVSGGAAGYIDFSYYNGAWYVASGFQQVPEPGTLVLIATGFLGLSVSVRKYGRSLRKPSKPAL